MSSYRALRTPLVRFIDKIERDNERGCWLWTGKLYGGYAKLRIGDRKVAAHRFAYEHFVGPIPDGLEVDHRCRVRHCVNPSHLRVTTTKQNHEHLSLDSLPGNASGVRGVSWVQGKWQGKVTSNGVAYHVGRFSDLDEAAAAVRAKRLELFTHNDLDRIDQ